MWKGEDPGASFERILLAECNDKPLGVEGEARGAGRGAGRGRPDGVPGGERVGRGDGEEALAKEAPPAGDALVPVLTGTAFKSKGVQPLPSPVEVEAIKDAEPEELFRAFV